MAGQGLKPRSLELKFNGLFSVPLVPFNSIILCL